MYTLLLRTSLFVTLAKSRDNFVTVQLSRFNFTRRLTINPRPAGGGGGVLKSDDILAKQQLKGYRMIFSAASYLK